MAFSPQLMRLSLDELRKKDRGYLHARPYTDFLPEKLENRQPANEESFFSSLGPIRQAGIDASALQSTLSGNKAAKQALARAQNQTGGIRQILKGLKGAEPNVKNIKPGLIDLSDINIKLSPKYIRKVGGHIGGRGNINLGKIRPGDPNAGVIHAQGHTAYVSGRYAPLFQGFLNALSKKGYKIESLGGYADRNIAGTSTPSLHSYGLALDINPTQNPVSYGSVHTNLPPGIGRLAAQYGLVWGGSWHGGKKDPMHFSIPYHGTK